MMDKKNQNEQMEHMINKARTYGYSIQNHAVPSKI